MSKRHFLEFEQPIAELDAKIEELRYVQNESAVDEQAIEYLITARNAAKRARDFAEADRLRQQLADQGILLKDSAQGTTWVKA